MSEPLDSVPMSIAGRHIGPHHPPYVIAEISANHLGGLDRALELVDRAAEAGADAVKLQHFTPDSITVRSDLPDFRVSGGTVWDGETLYELYSRAATPWEWTEVLIERAADRGLALFSSPFDNRAVDFLASLDTPAYKIASFELIDLPLIRHAAGRGKPLIISTGMASVGEIDEAVCAARDGGAPSIALLRCNSGYPADPSEMDLRAIPAMAAMWDVPIGLSDHTLTPTSAIAAVALGAVIVEKHLTLRRSEGGPDASFSLEPDEFAALTEALRETHASLGRVRFGPSTREVASIRYRRSLRAVRAIAADEPITKNNVRSVRPAGGLRPDEISSIVGMRAARPLEAGAAITWADLTRPPSNDD